MVQQVKAVASAVGVLGAVLLLAFSFWGALAYTMFRAARLAWGTCG